MKRNIQWIALSCLCFLSFGLPELSAQNPAEKLAPRYAISTELMYLYNAGLRVNFEYRLSKDNWLEWNLTPYYMPSNHYYHYTSNSNFDDFSRLSGIGTGFGYKYYFAPLFFINPNVSYTLYSVKYDGREYKEFTEDGLTYYQYKPMLQTQNFNKFTGCFNIGGRTPFRKSFMLEYYAGIGVAYSQYDSNKRAYDDTMFGFGYRGVYLTTGIKLGFHIR